MNVQAPRKLSKFQRYRANKKATGLKEIRMWVPDPKSPKIRVEMQRAAIELRGRKSEREAMDFIEAAMADMIKDIPPY